MVENTLVKMDIDKRQLAVLITGGFHTEGMTELFKDKGVSYIVVLPKFSHNALERPYEDIILNKKEPFEEILSNNEYYLAAPSIYSNLQPLIESLLALRTTIAISGGIQKASGLDVNEKLRSWLNVYISDRRNIRIAGETTGPVTEQHFEIELDAIEDYRVETANSVLLKHKRGILRLNIPSDAAPGQELFDREIPVLS